MNRLGLIHPASLSGAQKGCYDLMKNYTTSNYTTKFQYIDSKGCLIGPFGIQLHHPQLGEAFMSFAVALRSIPGLAADVRECAILAVGYRLEAKYELYAHEALSGYSDEELKMLREGKCPEHFTFAQKIAHRVATELGNPGPLDKDTWIDAVKVLSVDGATALIHYVAFYTYVSTILNGFDAGIPL